MLYHLISKEFWKGVLFVCFWLPAQSTIRTNFGILAFVQFTWFLCIQRMFPTSKIFNLFYPIGAWLKAGLLCLWWPATLWFSLYCSWNLYFWRIYSSSGCFSRTLFSFGLFSLLEGFFLFAKSFYIWLRAFTNCFISWGLSQISLYLRALLAWLNLLLTYYFEVRVFLFFWVSSRAFSTNSLIFDSDSFSLIASFHTSARLKFSLILDIARALVYSNSPLYRTSLISSFWSTGSRFDTNDCQVIFPNLENSSCIVRLSSFPITLWVLPFSSSIIR